MENQVHSCVGSYLDKKEIKERKEENKQNEQKEMNDNSKVEMGVKVEPIIIQNMDSPGEKPIKDNNCPQTQNEERKVPLWKRIVEIISIIIGPILSFISFIIGLCKKK